jgi:hypothetical protein
MPKVKGPQMTPWPFSDLTPAQISRFASQGRWDLVKRASSLALSGKRRAGRPSPSTRRQAMPGPHPEDHDDFDDMTEDERIERMELQDLENEHEGMSFNEDIEDDRGKLHRMDELKWKYNPDSEHP